MREPIDHPLLMKPDLVVSTIAGRKTNTRRVPPDRYRGWKRGELIYVRETWRTAKVFDDMSPSEIAETAVDAGFKPWAPIKYDCDGRMANASELSNTFGGSWGKTRTSIHMPKWASRLWLELTEDVTVEPLQDITKDDVGREGLNSGSVPYEVWPWRTRWIELWDSINAGRGYSWESKPEVAVIRFRVVSTEGRPT